LTAVERLIFALPRSAANIAFITLTFACAAILACGHWAGQATLRYSRTGWSCVIVRLFTAFVANGAVLKQGVPLLTVGKQKDGMDIRKL
jgi:hypothetical protein